MVKEKHQDSRFTKYVDWALKALLATVASYGLHLVDRMSENIAELNTKVAVVIEKSSNHDEKMRAFDQRLKSLEEVLAGELRDSR